MAGLHYLHLLLTFLLLLAGDSLQVETNFCDPSCAGSPAAEFSYQRGVRYTYRYSSMVTTSLQGSSASRNGLAMDCVVDIDVVSKCHLVMQIRNPQIRRLSPQKEHSVLRLKSLRESLERTRLKFSLRGGKVTGLCLQEGEQVWALNIKRAILSMLQTSPTASKVELQKETDVFGTCSSRYERRGPLLLKIRDLRQCQQARLENFWPHSVAMSEDTSLQFQLHCVQRHGVTVMEEVNCTEAVTLAAWSRSPGLVQTLTTSTLLLLRAQPGTPSPTGPADTGELTDLQFENERAVRSGKTRTSRLQKAGQSVRRLCSLTSDPQLVSKELVQLVLQLKDLTLSQLKTLWQEASFKCHNDWQPLLDALPACGSENCILLLADLMRSKELESFLTTMALIAHPSPHIVGSINALLEVPELRSEALLAGSSLVHQLCHRSPSSCSEIPQVQTFIRTVENILRKGCGGEDSPRVREVFYALKSVGNIGSAASGIIPLLSRCILDQLAALEMRLAAIQAFRRFPCSVDRSVLLQLYRSSQEDTEVRVAAYQQLMRCPDRDVFEVVKTMLRNEASSQVGSYVWSHLTNLLRSEDPMKQALIESLPDDIISRDFEAEFLKYSSYSDYTVSSGIGVQNVETSIIFSPKSFLPRSASFNLTVYFHGRAHNLLELDLRVENAEPLLKNYFGDKTENEAAAPNAKHEARRTQRKADEAEKEKCLFETSGYLSQARAMLFGRRKAENRPKCWVSIKVFGNELSVFTCEDLYHHFNKVSLSLAGLAVQLLKGQEVGLNRRVVLTTQDLVLPSLAGVPIKLALNLTALLSLHLKGNISYRDASHFSLNGYIKPSAYVGLLARMGVDGTLGQAAVEWATELRSSTRLDGSVQLQEGQDVRVTLNTPDDLMDIVSLSSRVFQLSGDHREEIKGPKSRVQRTTCTPKPWSKMIGWQLCSNASYPIAAFGNNFPPPGPAHLSLRLLKLDRGLSYYLLEAAYSLLHERGAWLPQEASIHLLLATPQSSIPRDMSLEMAFDPHRLLLRINHPLKSIHIQGQLEQESNIKSGKLELLVDGIHYYLMGWIDTHIYPSEQKTRYHLEVKTAADGHPMILSANVTRGSGRKTSFSATLKNVFRETALLSVALERRRDGSSRRYSVEVEVLLPDVVGGRMLGLMEQKGSLWSSVFRLKYGLRGDARVLRQECYTSQRLRSDRDSNLTYVMRADHEFYCTNTAPANHKIHLRHEESHRHVKSSVDVSYGKDWNEINNKQKLFLSQSFRNQSTENHTSYTLEFNLQVPETNLNYRTQLLHSHLKQHVSESSTHLKINYNNLQPLVAGLHWKSSRKDVLPKKWEGSFNMDTPWLYVHLYNKLNQPNRNSVQLTCEVTASRWVSIRNLVLEGFYTDRGREKEAHLGLHTPSVTYVQAGVWGVIEKRSVKASISLSSLWTTTLRGDVSLKFSKWSHTLQMASTYGQHNISLASALKTVDKILKKKRLTVKMSSEPKSLFTELEFEGVVEELRKDAKMYQKAAMLQLRQPFQIFPQTLLLRETFTIDLFKGLYILESKASFNGNPELAHTLTLGYRPTHPFVCSALIHPFNSDSIPSDSEICVTVSSFQTHKDVRGKLRVGSKDSLTFAGQVQWTPLHSTLQALKIKANLSHQLQLQLPSSAIVEGDVCWTPKPNNQIDYQARGRLRVGKQECKLFVQLNGTSSKIDLHSSLSHPFKSKIPKTLEVNASADMSTVPGVGTSSVLVRAEGKDRVMLRAKVFHSFQRGDGAVRLRVNLSQTLLPTPTDLHVNMAANSSSDSVFLRGSFINGQQTLLAQIKGTLEKSRSLRLALSGDLRHTMSSLNVLPSVLGLDGAIGQSDSFTEGQLRVRVLETVYRVELRHQQEEVLDKDDEDGRITKDEKPLGTGGWLCVWSALEHMCLNLSHQLGRPKRGEVYMQLSHSFHLLTTTGVPTNCSGQVKWNQDAYRLSAVAELQAGSEHLMAEFEGGRADPLLPQCQCHLRLQHQVAALLRRGLSRSLEAKAYFQLETERLDTGWVLYSEDARMIDVLFNVGSKNKTAILVASLWQQMELLRGLIPTSLQMSCTGDASADRFSAHCSGNMADRSVETLLPPQSSFNASITRSDSVTNLSADLQTDGTRQGRLNLSLTFHPHISLQVSILHSVEAIKKHFPTQATLLLNVLTARDPGVSLGLELGQCHFRAKVRELKASREEVEQLSSYSVNVTGYCPSLQGWILPTSLSFHGLLTSAPSQLRLSSSLTADHQDLSLELRHSSRPPHLSGTLTQSWVGLRRRGLPQVITVEASAPLDSEQAGDLFFEVGACNIRANRVLETRGETQRLWALESKCPMLQAHVNGSVVQDAQGTWTALLDAEQEDRKVFLTLRAKSWPELSVEAELTHDLPSLRRLPKRNRLKVTSSTSGTHRFDAEALVQLEKCVVRGAAAAMSQPGLQGSLIYHNNCTVIKEWGSPDWMQVSGSLQDSTVSVQSQMFLRFDEAELETSVALKKTKGSNEALLHLNHSVPLLDKLGIPGIAALTMKSGSQEIGSLFYIFNSSLGSLKFSQELTIETTSEMVTVKSQFGHTVNYLKKLGVPADNSIQVDFGSAEGRAFALQSQFGGQQAGVRLKMKGFPLNGEVSGTLWHSWTWLHDRGLPLHTEGLCSIQEVSTGFRSRAQLAVDRHKLFASGLNISSANGHLALLISFSPSAPNQTSMRHSLDTVLTAQLKGPLRSVSFDVHSQDWRLQAAGDVSGWGTQGWTKEARVTLKHTVRGRAGPALQVEAWGRRSQSQLRCSMAVNPELSSSLALIVQGHHGPHSKELMVKVVQNIPGVLIYLPAQLNIRSQLNRSRSAVAALLEMSSGRRRLWALGELAAMESGYKQALEVQHSYSQLEPLPRRMAVRTVYEAKTWSYQVQHGTTWGNQEFSLSALYSAPPAPEMGNQTLKVFVTCSPRLTSMEVTLEKSLHGRLDKVLLGWIRHGRLEQVRALSWWSGSEAVKETRLELQQPFSSTLNRLSLHTQSHRSEQRSRLQTDLSLDSSVPVNLSLILDKQWQSSSSRGQACALLWVRQMPVSSVKGCVSVGQEGNSYLQNAELRWDNRSVKQNLKYQKGSRGMHGLQVSVLLDGVSPAPCPSHTLTAKVQSNLRNLLEHTVLVGLCPPQPTLSWSGSHRLNSGEELFSTRSHLSVTGWPSLCSFSLALTNSSTAQSTNVSLFSESTMGNWSVEVKGGVLSGPRGSGVQVQATLDRQEKMWFNGKMQGRCLLATAGYMNGSGLSEDLTVEACVESGRSLTLEVQKRDANRKPETLSSVTVGTVEERLEGRASGCVETLTATEERLDFLSSQIQNKLLGRVKTLQRLLVGFRQQSRDSQLLQELSAVPLHVSQRATAWLGHRNGGMLALWRISSLRHVLTVSLPRFLALLQHASLLGQQELRRPLATLAGVYQDVKGQRLESVWRDAVRLWTERLAEFLPQTASDTLRLSLDVAGQQTFQWIETRLAMALSGVRKRLASIYKFSPGDCSVTVLVPLPPLSRWRGAEAGLMEILLEEGILRPLQTLASIRPAAELYHLKRMIMDSPFAHQAYLVADQFVVTFDGRLYELPGSSCPLLLAQDVSADPSFTVLLCSDPLSFLLIQINNSTVHIRRNGEVKVDCTHTIAKSFGGDIGLTVRKHGSFVQVSNQKGMWVSCDLSQEVCSFTLDGWLHGANTGLLGTNDNDAGNDLPLQNGSQSANMEQFFHSWQMTPKCNKPPSSGAMSPLSCDFLFSSDSDSPLSACFRVVDPARFFSVCKSSSSRAPCRLASAYVHLCRWNYVPLEVPVQCLKA